MVKKYEAEICGNLYALVVERSSKLLNAQGYLGLIIPTPSICTERMSALQKHLISAYKSLYISNYDATSHPGILFVGVQYQLSILIGQRAKGSECELMSTLAMRWSSEERQGLFNRIVYTSTKYFLELHTIPKFSNLLEKKIIAKISSTSLNNTQLLGSLLKKNGNKIFYRNAGNVYFRMFLTELPFFTVDGKQASSSTLKILSVSINHNLIAGVLSSNIFYWWWSKVSDIYHVVSRDLVGFPVPILRGEELDKLVKTYKNYLKDLFEKSKERTYRYSTGLAVYQELYPRNSKALQNEIDRVLAKHYGLTDEELDFIINYDIKYRMGRGSEDED